MGELEVGVALLLSPPETSSQMYPQATGLFPHTEQDPKHHTLELSRQTQRRHQGPFLGPLEGAWCSEGASLPTGRVRPISGHVSEGLLSHMWRAAWHVNKSGLRSQDATS